MTFEQVKKLNKPFNRKVYDDGWYVIDRRNVSIHQQDLSQRFWTEEDLNSNDWIVKGKHMSADEIISTLELVKEYITNGELEAAENEINMIIEDLLSIGIE